jgi:hypothetical protein
MIKLLINVRITSDRSLNQDRSRLNDPSRVEVFKYCLLSMSTIPIDDAVLYFDAPEENLDTLCLLEDYAYSLYPSIQVYRHRLQSKDHWSSFLKLNRWSDEDIVLYAGNDDHIFIDKDLNALTDAIAALSKVKNSAINYSHWQEWIGRREGLFLDEGSYFLQYPNYQRDSIIISRFSLIKSWISEFLESNGTIMRRFEDFDTELKRAISIIIPKRELFRHFDGYSSSGILPTDVPPLSIPSGKVYFPKTTSVRKTEWNVKATRECLVQNNLVIYPNETPFFWRERGISVEGVDETGNEVMKDVLLSKINSVKSYYPGTVTSIVDQFPEMFTNDEKSYASAHPDLFIEGLSRIRIENQSLKINRIPSHTCTKHALLIISKQNTILRRKAPFTKFSRNLDHLSDIACLDQFSDVKIIQYTCLGFNQIFLGGQLGGIFSDRNLQKKVSLQSWALYKTVPDKVLAITQAKGHIRAREITVIEPCFKSKIDIGKGEFCGSLNSLLCLRLSAANQSVVPFALTVSQDLFDAFIATSPHIPDNRLLILSLFNLLIESGVRPTIRVIGSQDIQSSVDWGFSKRDYLFFRKICNQSIVRQL